MTEAERRKLDEDCCVFAGLEPVGTIIKGQPVEMMMPWIKGNKIENLGYAVVPVYPPVSTDGAAAWRLMEALKDKGIDGKVAWAPSYGFQWEGHVFSGVRRDHPIFVEADSGPLALALAVAELARRTK